MRRVLSVMAIGSVSKFEVLKVLVVQGSVEILRLKYEDSFLCLRRLMGMG